MRDASDCSESPALAASSAGAISIVRNQSKHVHRVVSITRSDIAFALTPPGDARAHHGRNVLRLDDRQISSLVVPHPIFSITVSTAGKLRCRLIEPVGQRAEILLSTFSVDNPVHCRPTPRRSRGIAPRIGAGHGKPTRSGSIRLRWIHLAEFNVVGGQQHLLQSIVKQASVREPGQRIETRQLFELMLHRLRRVPGHFGKRGVDHDDGIVAVTQPNVFAPTTPSDASVATNSRSSFSTPVFQRMPGPSAPNIRVVSRTCGRPGKRRHGSTLRPCMLKRHRADVTACSMSRSNSIRTRHLTLRA
jgi:hypothetical protein